MDFISVSPRGVGLLYRRPLFPGEPDPELLWGSVLSASALVAAGWLIAGLPTPLCPLHALTGLPCPTCGATRAASALLHGHLVTALAWNPLMAMGVIGIALYVLYAGVVVIGKFPRLRLNPLSSRGSLRVRTLIALLIVANWTYLFWRKV